jgi:phage baseplate assembly protein W
MLFKTSIKYPLTFSLTTGKTDLDTLTTSINRCIGLILTTGKGELLGDPDFGCRLYELLFEQYSDNLQQTVKREILDSLSKFESRVSLTENDITIEHVENSDRNRFKITLTYSIKGTQRRSETNFYMEEGMNIG